MRSIVCAIAGCLMLNSCATTQVTEKAAYINNEQVLVKGEKINAVSLFAVSMKSDKSIYEQVLIAIQGYCQKKNVSSDMHFFDATEDPATIGSTIRKGQYPYYLIIDQFRSSAQKNELNVDFLVKQVNVILEKGTGEHIADLTIAVDKNTTSKRLGKQLGDIITGYLSKKGLL